LKKDTRVVIIGAGIVGCATAERLTELGLRNITVIDQGPLFATGGSTSHAPGLVFQTNASRTMTLLAKATVRRYLELELASEPCFYPVGGLEVASTPERWQDLKRKKGLAASWGLEGARLLGPEACAEKIPLLDPERIYGGYFMPSDGIAKALYAAEALAKRAQSRGAVFHERTEVTGFDIKAGRVRGVETTKGGFAANVVLCCAGIWGPKIGRMAGVSIPVQPLAHQFIWTTPLEELQGETAEVRHPILRHQDEDLYFRQQGKRYGVGSYAHRPMPLEAEEILPVEQAPVMPSVRAFTPEDFAPAWRRARELLPALGKVAIDEAMNGLFLFNEDGLPVLGESRQVRGFWVAEAVWISHAGGVGEVMAEWIARGVPPIDVRVCDLNRFEAHSHSRAYLKTRASQNFIEVYDVIHPLQPLERPRPLRVSPFYARHQELGAYFLEASGWERPHWFEANAHEIAGRDIPMRDEWAGRYWSAIVGAEHQITRERVALYDMSTLNKAEVSGAGALEFLQRLASGNMDMPLGRVSYTLMLNEAGGIKSDITVARLKEHLFQIGCNGPLDFDWFARHLPPDNSVHVQNVTGALCCLGVWGPYARDLLECLSTADFSHKGHGFFRAKEVFIGEVPVRALRLSYVGELGWELYAPAEYGLRLWELLWEAGQAFGIIAAGRGAFNGLRLEKGYRAYGIDMHIEHDPFKAGLGFAVKLDKEGFIGREALLARKAAGPGTSSPRLCLTCPARW
jgi:dimethylglycine oxidase